MCIRDSGCSWHNFAEKYEESFLFGEENSRIQQYYPLLDFQGRRVVRSMKSAYLVPWAQYTLGLPLKVYDQRLLQHMLRRNGVGRDDFEFFGGYQKTASSNLDPRHINRKLEVYFNSPDSRGSNISAYMDDYLERILDLCAIRNVRVILINTPVYEAYRRGVPENLVHHLDTILVQMKAKFPNLIVVDYSSSNLERNYFYDGDHVNQFGAEMVTRQLADSRVMQQ